MGWEMPVSVCVCVPADAVGVWRAAHANAAFAGCGVP